jgi:6-phosphofructokinase 2
MSGPITLTLNPAIDMSTSVAEVRAGPKLRCDAPRRDPGGGGVNVSRAIRLLGGDSTALVAVGGPTGAGLVAMLADEGLAVVALEVAGETRTSLALTDRATGGQYRFVMPGPAWGAAELAAWEARLAELMAPGALVVLSGSQPRGVPDGWPLRLAAQVAAAGGRLIADTSGAPLRALATGRARPFLLRMDAAEAEDLAGHGLATATETAAFARGLVQAGAAEAVIVARGAEGSLLAGAEGVWLARCPVAAVVSAVGAGDSFVGGLALALARGAALPEALRHGTAAAAAAVMTEAPALCRREDAERLLRATTLERQG